MQDACVHAWRQLGSLRQPDRFDAWIGRILLNSCRARLRSRRRTHVREIDITKLNERDAEAEKNGVALAQRVVEIDAVPRAFLRLRPENRVILALHHAERRPIGDISALLGVPDGTVKWRLHAARKALAKALERER